MPQEVTSSGGASGVWDSDVMLRHLVNNVMNKYHVSRIEAMNIVRRSRVHPVHTRESLDVYARTQVRKYKGI